MYDSIWNEEGASNERVVQILFLTIFFPIRIIYFWMKRKNVLKIEPRDRVESDGKN